MARFSIKGAFNRVMGYHIAEGGWDHEGKPPVLNKEKKRELMEATSMETARGTFRTLGKMIGMYWTQAGKHEIAIATGLAATTLGMSALSVQVLVEYSDWYRQFMDIFQNVGALVLQQGETLKEALLAEKPELEGDEIAFNYELGKKFFNLPEMQEHFENFKSKLLVEFPTVVGKYLVTAIAAFTAAQHLALRWRTWITGKFTNEWLKDKAFYKLKNVYNNIDNPDQRIQEDLDKLTDGMVSITTEGMQSMLTLGAFGTLLYTSFGSFNPAVLGGPDIDIQGYLFWSAVAYAAVGTGALAAVARKLPDVFRRKQVAEGSFRAGLISAHTNSEQIALNNGEQVEKHILRRQFRDVVDVTREYINIRKAMIVINSVHANLGSVIPYIAASPLFFAGQVTFGQVSQTAYAFRQVENSFSFFMNNLQFFASMKANIDRLGTLMYANELSHFETAEQKAKLEQDGTPTPNAPKPL